ncbi:MAG: hypothetical protein ACE5G8_13315, partial [Anaerolineae bacterium]
NVRFQEPDLKTLHTVARIQRLNSRATIFVELHRPDSRFVQYLSRPVMVLDSRALLESVLRERTLNLTPYFTRVKSDGRKKEAPQLEKPL